jgi:tetratricopeptide (TPR) repeat protein
MRKRIFIALMASLPTFWVALPAAAQSFDDAVALTVNGDWLMAADMGAALETSEGYALAAQALAIYGYHVAPKEEKQPLFQRGMDYAEKAIELGPDSSEAHLQASHAMGRYAQTIGVLQALSEGFADRIKDVLDKAIALDPQNFNAYVSLGAWNAEIVNSAGIMAKVLYGATEEDALANYARALEIAPEDASVNLEYAIGLLTLDKNDNAAEARKYFQRAIEFPVENAYGLIVRENAQARLAGLDG